MKFSLCMIGCLVVVLGHVRADPEPVTPDTRKARHPVNGPTNYNSISVPDSETLSKLQNQVAPSVQQIPLKPIGLPTKSETGSYSVTPSPLANLHVPTTANQNLAGQYYMAMATPHAAGNQVLAPAASPLIMQYINPQGQPTGGLQYIQLLRPVMYNPYGTQYVQPSYVQQPTVGINQHQHQHHSHSLAHYSHAGVGPVAPPSPTSTPTATTQSSFVPFQPSSLQQPQYGTVASPSHHHGHLTAAAPVAAYSNPIGQYSSPMLSYFAPPRISLINGPGDLNTNEYMPNPGDHVFIKGVKTIRA